MVRLVHSLSVVALPVAVSALAASAWAQPSPYSDVPDRFRIEAGAFRIGADTSLSFNTAGGTTTPIDFETLNVPDNATRFYVEGFWRPWRRHQFSLSWYSNNRDGESHTADHDFTWGDLVITTGSSVRGRVGSDYFSGVYRFAAYKNDRFEIGPSLGIGYLKLEAGIAGQVNVSAGGASASVPFDVSKDFNQPTGDVGGYFYWWAARRLLVRGDMRYILVKPENSEASITDGRAAALYHIWPQVGIGLQYTYTKFRYDRGFLSRELGGNLRYSGGQIVLAGAF